MSEKRQMQAVKIESFGDPGQLTIGQWPMPAPAPRELLVQVAATALNRADTLQRQGKYPPPSGESPLLGLEMAGTVVETGSEVARWKTGDRVCGLLGGGGYAQYAAIHEEMAMRIPDELSFEQAAAIPEVWLTAYQALRWLAGFQAEEWLLIHAGASGVGTAAIQLARQMKAGKILVTASAPKHDICRELGADLAIDYQNKDFKKAVFDYSNERGVDVVIDFIGAPYFQRNLNVLRTDGRLVMLALMGGVQPDSLSLGPILRKRLQVTGSTLRARSLEYKIKLTQAFSTFAWPLFQSGYLRPVIDRVFDWRDVVAAHEYMEANKNKGKIILQVK